MRIFIDTEFSDFVNPELISIGLVTDCGEDEFYAELPVNLSRCNDFVLAIVLPQLCHLPGVLYDRSQLRIRLIEWLNKFEKEAPVVISYDYEGDWILFCDLVSNDIPEWISGENIYQNIDAVALQRFFIERKVKDHHALNDAKANRYAYTRSECE